MFENLFEKDKRLTIVYAREKKVDKDLCPKNCSFQLMTEKKRSTKTYAWKIVVSNLDPITEEYFLVLYLSLIFLCPQCCKSQFFEDRTENCTLEPRKPMSED